MNYSNLEDRLNAINQLSIVMERLLTIQINSKVLDKIKDSAEIEIDQIRQIQNLAYLDKV